MTSLSSLFGYWTNAKKNKLASLRVQRFGDDPLRHLMAIQVRLRARAFEFGPYKTFIVREKKHRHVVDAPMKDRIVHWLLYEYLMPIWQPRFIADTFGNLPGRGTHAAVRRLAEFARGASSKWVLQLDISKYFYSVNHSLLKGMILRYIGDQDIRALLVNLVDSFRTGDEYDGLFATDTMYRRTPAKGMPIGSLTSQLFANIFLCAFDHWVKQTLRIKMYLRYVDDLTFLAETKEELLAISAAVVEYLATMGLTIHPFKVRLAPAAAGIPYLGYVVWPNHVSVGAYGRRRYHQRLRQHEIGGRDRTESLTSYKALFSHTGSTIHKTKGQQ
jgi:RNA-directed DNA polymerase